MIDRPAMSPARVHSSLCCCVAAGCAGVKHKQAEAVPTAAPAARVRCRRPVASPPETVTAPARCGTEVPEAASRWPAARSSSRWRPAPPLRPRVADSHRPAGSRRRTAASTPAPAVVSKPTQAPAASPPAAAPLDFASLGTRLRQTKAIGTLTKLSLKNQVDDLLGKFRAYHKRQGTATLPELRRSYDMLLLKVLSLLQDSDPPLARDIVQSRAAIWGILADPRKFTESNLMAGAAT